MISALLPTVIEALGWALVVYITFGLALAGVALYFIFSVWSDMR